MSEGMTSKTLENMQRAPRGDLERAWWCDGPETKAGPEGCRCQGDTGDAGPENGPLRF